MTIEEEIRVERRGFQIAQQVIARLIEQLKRRSDAWNIDEVAAEIALLRYDSKG